DIAQPWPVDDEAEEKSRAEEEVGHAERLRERHDMVHPHFALDGYNDAQRRVHHHHEDDADALGSMHPSDTRSRLRHHLPSLQSVSRPTGLMRHASGSSFYACRYPKTGSHFGRHALDFPRIVSGKCDPTVKRRGQGIE